MGLLLRKSRRARSFVIVQDHVFADVNAADAGDIAAESFGHGSCAAGVVEKPDFTGGLLVGRCPLGSEPIFALLQGVADLLGDADLPGFGVVC